MGNLFTKLCNSCCGSKEPDPRHLFLFVGPKGVGKSTAIKSLFGKHSQDEETLPSQSPTTISEIDYFTNNFKIVEAPGFYSGISVHDNATVLVSISKYLDHHGEPPTGLFIIARVKDPANFEDHDFMTQLKTLSLLNSTTAKLHADNVVLLLTHADTTAADKEEIVKAYRHDFKKVLNFEPVCLTVNVASPSVNEMLEQLTQEHHLQSGKLHKILENHLHKHKTPEVMEKVNGNAKLIEVKDLPDNGKPDNKRHEEFASVLETHHKDT